MSFHKGQRVVVVDDQNGFGAREIGFPFPLQSVVVIANAFDGQVSIVGDRSSFGDVRFWSATRFCHVEEKQTDISIFTALLNPNKQRESERV